MNNEPSNHDALETIDDPQLEALLADAYDVPPLPRTLLKRIDRAVEAEWGRPVGPASGSGTPTDWAGELKRGMIRFAPIAASLMFATLLGVMLIGDARAYGWSSVLEALNEHGVVQVDTAEGSRWLSLSDEVVAVVKADETEWFDGRDRTVLAYRPGATEVRRRPWARRTGPLGRQQLALAFLTGDTGDDLSRLDEAEVVSESWKPVDVEGAEQIALTVVFQTASAEQRTLTLWLDPESKLPLAFTSDAPSSSERAAVSYPTETVAELRQRAVPPHLVIVDDAGSGNETVIASAADAVPEAEEGNSADRRGEAVPLIDGDAAGDPPAESQSGMRGPPSQWRPVTPVDLPAERVVERVNQTLAALWQANGVTPADAATDEELLRRVYLDLAGRTPSVSEVRAYLNDRAPHRYEQLVDRLLASPDHASHMAVVWRTFLIPDGVDLTRFGGVEAFDKWLAERFATGESYDNVVRSLLLAEGRLSRSGPLLFYSAAKLDADQLASRTARVFLGMRLECAQCHDHPFEPWTQDDFWSFAAFFSRISRPQAELETVSTVMRVSDVDRGEAMIPDTGIVVEPAFLDQTEISEDAKTLARRQQLAQWLTSPENPYFARATANRVWGHLFGKGIVDPIDDFGTQNPPKSPELLDLLAGHFVSSDFSLRELFRAIVLSRAYRLSSGAANHDERRLEWFAQMNVKTLTAEQVYDCIVMATRLDRPTDPTGFDGLVRFGNSAREEFINQFRTPVGQRTEYLGGIPQALTLMNGTLISDATGLASSGLLTSLEGPFFSNRDRIEILYLATLSRFPRESERELIEGYITDETSGAELQEALADILWALLNSAEFTMNH